MAPPIDIAITAIVRKDWGRILAALVKTLGDFQLAEDCLQDAVVAAMTAWENGPPRAPDAWLITTAKRRAVDRIRRDQTFARKSPQIALFYDQQRPDPEQHHEEPEQIPDRRLEMLFTCCHPALDPKSQTALTLRTLGGLTAEEIASAFLDKPATMAQRLSRARSKIKLAGIPYQIPEPSDLPQRLDSVMRVIYLIFNGGYSASSGDALQRHGLMNEAIKLGRTLCDQMPDATEASGLLALMLFHHARRAGRTDGQGGMVALEHQDRSLWDHSQIAKAEQLLRRAMGQGKIGAYQLQAAIAALHAQSPSWSETDWPQIAALYGVLGQVHPSPVVRLNHAVALSYAGQLPRALTVLEDLAAPLASYSHFHAARADLLRRDGQLAAAADCFETAISLTENAVDRAFLRNKMDQLHMQ